MIQCRKEVQQSIHLFKRIRQEIHMHPEIGFQTLRTWSYIKQEVPLFSDSLVENGGVFVLPGKGKTIGIRCELDALEINEQGQVPYRSTNHYMHACGHDGHIAIVICCIHYFLKQKNHPTLVFIFQPAEETGVGAKAMIKNGLLKKYPMDAIFGCHLYPHLPDNAIGSREEQIMASSQEWKCRIQGKSGHVANGLGIDSIKAMHHFLTLLYALNHHDEIIHVGKIQGGEICNGFASTCQIHGTMRSFDSCQHLKGRLIQIGENIDACYQTKTSFEWSEGYEVVNNNKDLVNLLKEVCAEDYVEMSPLFLSEDFSFYTKYVPSCFFFVGINTTADLHESCFDFNERDGLKAIEILIRLVEKMSESVDKR